MLRGRIGDLRIPDAILVDVAGYRQLWPGEPLHIGQAVMELIWQVAVQPGRVAMS
jgi:hypothetical protein